MYHDGGQAARQVASTGICHEGGGNNKRHLTCKHSHMHSHGSFDQHTPRNTAGVSGVSCTHNHGKASRRNAPWFRTAAGLIRLAPHVCDRARTCAQRLAASAGSESGVERPWRRMIATRKSGRSGRRTRTIAFVACCHVQTARSSRSPRRVAMEALRAKQERTDQCRARMHPCLDGARTDAGVGSGWVRQEAPTISAASSRASMEACAGRRSAQEVRIPIAWDSLVSCLSCRT